MQILVEKICFSSIVQGVFFSLSRFGDKKK